MADLDSIETRAAGNLDALYWWRRAASSEAQPPEPLTQRLVAIAERVAPARTVAEPPPIIELPGNRLRANGEGRRVDRAISRRRDLNAELPAARRHERRRATYAVALGVLAAAAPTAASLYAAAMHEPVALGLALAGSVAASFGLYRALCWPLLIPAGDSREIVRASPRESVIPATRKRAPRSRLPGLRSTARYRAPERHL